MSDPASLGGIQPVVVNHFTKVYKSVLAQSREFVDGLVFLENRPHKSYA